MALRSFGTVLTAGIFTLTLAAVGCGEDEATGGGSDAGAGGEGAEDGGAGGEDPGEDDGYTGECTRLGLGETALYFGSVARVGLEVPVTPPVAALARTRLTLELYESNDDGPLPALEPGSYPFAEAPDDSYATCQHCVLLVAYDRGGAPVRAFYPKNGTFRLDHVSDEDYTQIAGGVEKSEIVEVVQNEDLSWSELPGGDCFYLSTWEFDTRPLDGGECTSAEACPNETLQICDPELGVCGAQQCSLTGDPPYCDEGEFCMSQLFDADQAPMGPAAGACYRECDVLDSDGCAEGEICRPLGPTQDFGVCLAVGRTKLGERCTPSDISTGCEEGAVCSGEPPVCARICHFLMNESGCDEDTYCALSNLCEPAQNGDPAAIGEVCQPSSSEGIECGIEGDAFRGLCIKFFPEEPELRCERLCSTSVPDCPGEEQCLGLFSNPSVGVCRVPAVCGDGVVDAIGGEVCDDDNTEDGDGCSADCSAPELDVLCENAEVLELDTTVEGTTKGKVSGYASNCDPYVATPVAIYAFSPSEAGRLRLELTSDAELGLGVLGNCSDNASELACRNLTEVDVLDVNVAAAPETPLLVVVRGATPKVSGSFELVAHFDPAVCGDGTLAGAEVCDDGNTEDGDGCSADCSALDWDFVCEHLPELELDTTIEGDTSEGGSAFDLSGVCSFVGGGGREIAYAFEAPSDGTLSLTLAQPDDNFSLYVQSECGPVTGEEYLACSNYAWPGEEESTTAELVEGQRVTVIVDGFAATDEGPFELRASFSPN